MDDAKTCQPLDPDRVDLPAEAGRCRVHELVPPALWSQATDVDLVFRRGATAASSCAPLRDPWQDQECYARLTARELDCGKLGLSTKVHAVGGSLASARAEAGRERCGMAVLYRRWPRDRRRLSA